METLLVPRAPAVLRTASKRLAAVDAYCKLYQHRVHKIDSYGLATQRVKLEASIMSQTNIFNSFLHVLRCRKKKEAHSNRKSPVELNSYGHLVT